MTVIWAAMGQGLKSILDFFDPWSGFASVLGVVIAFFGFGVTIWKAWAASRSARFAQIAAQQALGSLRRVNTIQQLTEAISKMEVADKYINQKYWGSLYDLCRTLCSLLIET